jgi:hypothetical protein
MPRRLIAIGLMLAACSHPHAQQKLEPQAPAAAPPATADASADAVPAAPAPAGFAVDFERDVEPIVQSRCQPCHFAGGKMYERLPFDKPETIRELGERLFSRIKAENEQAVIRAFLAQPR